MRSYFCFNRILAGVILLLLLATIFYACGKDNTSTPASDVNDNKVIAAATAQSAVSSIYDDLFSVGLQISTETNLYTSARKADTKDLEKRLGACFSVEIDDATYDKWPKTVTVDFGTGCPDSDGRMRAGKVEFVFSGFLFYKGSSVTINLISYKVDGISVSGTKTITNLSTGASVKYQTAVKNGVVILDTLTLGYSSNRIISQTYGAETADFFDDIYALSGTDSLIYPGGAAATITVNEAEALEKKLDCAWVGKGIAAVTFDQLTALVDYGNGVCDDSATINIGDKVKGIQLPR